MPARTCGVRSLPEQELPERPSGGTDMEIDPIRNKAASPVDTYSLLAPPVVSPTARSLDQVEPVVSSAKSELATDHREIAFGVDAESDVVVISVRDKKTDDVILQIPQERFLELARELKKARRARRQRLGDRS